MNKFPEHHEGFMFRELRSKFDKLWNKVEEYNQNTPTVKLVKEKGYPHPTLVGSDKVDDSEVKKEIDYEEIYEGLHNLLSDISSLSNEIRLDLCNLKNRQMNEEFVDLYNDLIEHKD